MACFMLVSATVSAGISASRKAELHDLLLEDCGACHGITLKGSLGPSLRPTALAGKSKAFIVSTILHGRKNTPMPAWLGVLSRDDASWIADQLLNGTTGAPD